MISHRDPAEYQSFAKSPGPVLFLGTGQVTMITAVCILIAKTFEVSAGFSMTFFLYAFDGACIQMQNRRRFPPLTTAQPGHGGEQKWRRNALPRVWQKPNAPAASRVILARV